MWYLITQILFCLLVAFLFGLLIGYLLWKRNSYQGDDVSQLEKTWRANLASKEEEVARLRAELDGCQAKVAGLTTAAPAAAIKSQTSSKTSISTPAAVKDDLQRIWGVGPYLEKKLNAVGITSFRQIANLTAVEIDKLGETFNSFSDRIERDAWKEQAAKLHKEKYGDDA